MQELKSVKIQSVIIPESFNKTFELFTKMIQDDNNFKEMLENTTNRKYKAHKQNKLISISIRFAIADYVRRHKAEQIKLIKEKELLKLKSEEGEVDDDE